MIPKHTLIVISAAIALSAANSGWAQTTLGSAWTYQGKLNQLGEPLNATADLEFSLWDEPSGGAQIGTTLAVDNVSVVDGLFIVELDFGAAAFNGDARWLEVAVRSPHDPGDLAVFTTLNPRQPLTATPYALQTRGIVVNDAGAVGLGTATPSARLDISDGDVNSALRLQPTNLGPELIYKAHQGGTKDLQIVYEGSAGAQTEVMTFKGNGSKSGFVGIGTTSPTTKLQVAGTVTASAFAGDGSGLNFNVNGARILRLEPAGSGSGPSGASVDFGGNVIAGLPGNSAVPGARGATIAGGGASGDSLGANRVFDHLTFVGGGEGNVAGSQDGSLISSIGATVAGGMGNTASALQSAILGGSGNLASGFQSVVAGGLANEASGRASAVGGGMFNTAAGETSVAAGNRAEALHDGTFVWADQELGGVPFSSTADNQYLIRANGGVGIGTNAPANQLSVAGDADFSGNVGIGTATPAAELDVNGTVAATAFVGDGAGLTNVHVSSVTSALGAVQVGSGVEIQTRDLSLDQEITQGGGVSIGETTEWQSFTCGATGDLVQVEVYRYFSPGRRPDAAIVRLYEGEGTSGALLATTSIPDAGATTWQAIQFENVATIVAGQQYTIALTSDEGSPNYGIRWMYNGSNTYAGGRSSDYAHWDRMIRTYVASEDLTRRVLIDGQGRVGIGRDPTTNALEVEGSASKSIAGNWAANSDRRIKTDIQSIDNALDTLERVRLVSFAYTDAYQATHAGVGGGRYLNVIAQEFAEVFPDHVKRSGELLPDGSEILQVDTYPLTIYSAAAIQELRAEKDEQIAQLRADNEALQKRLAKLEAAHVATE